MIGRRLSHYDVVEEIGRGGMGVVYRARDVKLDREVAIKVLPSELLADPQRRRRFVQEARAAAAVKHPNIAVVHEIDEVEGRILIAMELVEGESLDDTLARGPMPLELALDVARQVARGLASAHDTNIVHRDLKPSNVMLGADGQVKIIDFGVAKLGQPQEAVASAAETLSQETASGVVVGTAACMSPEQARGQPVDHRSDIFSFGSLLYELVAGRSPFRRDSMVETLSAVLHHEPPPPPQAPAAVRSILERCLNKDPAKRFRSTAELVDSLTRASASPPSSRWRTSRTGVAAVLAAILAVALWRVAVRESPTDPTAELPAASGGMVDSLPADRVAVLYLDDHSAAGELGHVAGALTEGVIHFLSRVDALEVISRNGVKRYRESDASIHQIARALNVGTIVAGSISASEETLRITVQLVDGNDESQIYSSVLTTTRGDWFSTQDELLGSVTEGLRRELGKEIELRVIARSASNVDAWERAARGRERMDQGFDLFEEGHVDAATAAVAQAHEFFRSAISLDPRWSEAHVMAGEADYWMTRWKWGSDADLQPYFSEALQHAEAALALDDRSAAAYELRATTNYWSYLIGAVDPDQDPLQERASAERDFRRALELEPERASAGASYSHLLLGKNDPAGAERVAITAYENDAFLRNADTLIWRIFSSLYDKPDFARAREWCEEGERRFPGHVRFVECRLLLLTDPASEPDPARALELVQEMKSLEAARDVDELRANLVAASIVVRAGDVGQAGKMLDAYRASELAGRFDEAVYLARIHILLGDLDSARAALARGDVEIDCDGPVMWWYHELCAPSVDLGG